MKKRMGVKKHSQQYFKIVTIAFSLFALIFVAKIMNDAYLPGQTLGVQNYLAKDNEAGRSGGLKRQKNVRPTVVEPTEIERVEDDHEKESEDTSEQPETELEVEVEVTPSEDLIPTITMSSETTSLPGQRHEEIKTSSKLPMVRDFQKNTLEITTSKGKKTVTLMPETAVKNAISNKVIDEVESESADGSAQRVELVDKKGDVEFKISGVRKKKMFGFIPISVEKDITVSAITGEVTGEQLDWTNRLKNFLSF